ncbi:hypothetical protein [Variovorax boronicumulans]|uniref:hypothetical protein n=1 Tax=Variovorax boronicumulans TaxID=436515 RepID=UPI002785613F|nr:hypothetical protein [Variovorax boronicumulans]MDQ0040834.1 hypothetical protein [Variovorax boronicumulans]
MAQVKLLTRDGAGDGVVSVSGSKVLVGDRQLDRVQSVRLDGEPGQPWVLTVTVFVDPRTLFETLPADEG